MNEIRGGRTVRKSFLNDGVDTRTKKEQMFTISHAVFGPTGTRTQSVFAYDVYVCVLKSTTFGRSTLQGTCSKINNRKACLVLSVESLILEWFMSSVQCEKSKACVRYI